MRKLILLSICLFLIINVTASPRSSATFKDPSGDVRKSDDSIISNPSLDIIALDYLLASDYFTLNLTFADVPEVSINTYYMVEVSFNLKSDTFSNVRWQVIYNSFISSLRDNDTSFVFHNTDDSTSEHLGITNRIDNSLLWTSDTFTNQDFSNYLTNDYELRYVSAHAYHFYSDTNHHDQMELDSYPSSSSTNTISDSDEANEEESAFLTIGFLILPVIALKKSRS
ncbi:MAG: hypothetical protein INQ03_25675 [Candidatus Heimdallarchaeota archaeon]|nr:hypothetical protein [Candidatus Heimdallarchaeota archaeon]